MAAKSRTMAQQKTKEAYCFIVPAFIYMILVLGYPIVYNIILSLKVDRADGLALFNDVRNQQRITEQDRKSTRLNSSHSAKSRMPSSA